jgi:hypothetical protein
MQKRWLSSGILAIFVTVVFAADWQFGQSGGLLFPVSDVQAAGGVVERPNVIAPD